MLRKFIGPTLLIICILFMTTPTPISADPGRDTVLRRIHIPILMYHYISVPPANADKLRLDLSVTPENFRHQMQWIQQTGFTPISVDTLINALTKGKKLPEHPIMLTFDDGYVDAFTDAYPILKEFGYVGNFFVVTGWIDSNKSGVLNWSQVTEMAKAGMYIGSHSRLHTDMRAHDHLWYKTNLVGTLDDIQAHIGVRPRAFCYPAGHFDDTIIAEEKAAGILVAFTIEDGTYALTNDMLRLPRVRIRGSTTMEEFRLLVTTKR